jgi:hypothetical protein
MRDKPGKVASKKKDALVVLSAFLVGLFVPDFWHP